MKVTNRKMTTDEIQEILHQLDGFLVNMRSQWDEQNPGGMSWWRINQLRLTKGTQFIINSLDQMIQWVEDLIPAGPDKKAAVTLMAGKLFDYIVVQAFPIWLKPFAPAIRAIIINIVVGKTIDFIVEKYNAGIWKKDSTNAQAFR